MIDFDTYIKIGEPGGKERAEARKTAIGLQAVDGLKTSEYLNETAAKHIEGTDLLSSLISFLIVSIP